MNTTVDALRSFNDFYTDIAAQINKAILQCKYNIPEAKILMEIAGREECSAKDILSVVKIHKGYISRVLERLRKKQFITIGIMTLDRRYSQIRITPLGKGEVVRLNEAINNAIRVIILHLDMQQEEELVVHLQSIQGML